VGVQSTCNPAGDHAHPCCAADFDQNGQISIQDVFSFLGAWFNGSQLAHITADSGNGLPGPPSPPPPPGVQDIFEFIAAWFIGC